MNDWENYYQLKEGEIIQEGDECLCDEKWEPATYEIGTPAPNLLCIAHRIYRRRKTAIIQSEKSLVDLLTGAGYQTVVGIDEIKKMIKDKSDGSKYRSY